MNIFVLNTGRCGSTTFIKACSHITNYSSAHESRTGLLGPDRFAYPENHIEADNRLSWFLGRLDEAYGDNAMYVHLFRDTEKTARSLLARSDRGIMDAYRHRIVFRASPDVDPLAVCRDYCETVHTNIRHFLRDKSRVMTFECDEARRDFPLFWKWIDAKGDYDAALAEWNTAHNATKPPRLWRRLTGKARLRT